jgi:hypothetical protein
MKFMQKKRKACQHLLMQKQFAEKERKRNENLYFFNVEQNL